MIFGCCTAMEHYDQLVKLGYDAITLSGTDLAGMSEDAFHKTCRIAEKGKLVLNSVNDFCRKDIRLTGPASVQSPQVLKEYCARQMRRAKALGIRYIGVGAPYSRSLPEGYPIDDARRDFLFNMELIAECAEQYGLVVLLEAISAPQCNFITVTDEAYAFIKAFNHPNVRLVYDTYHAYRMGEDTAIVHAAIEKIRVVHTAHFNGEGRTAPAGEYQKAHEKYFDAILQAGFDGEVTFEADLQEPEEMSHALRAMKELCEKSIEASAVG
ncbi:sugar phosphate isomerase/epimerase [Christensenellaceae bacterium OttesenSCG-928-M15]|nr:sugar phosphate isomerase/epimerase [Christensenellaceae bacterium OttesenSCG-928-M15]